MATPETPFGPTGEAVYKRSYSRETSPGVFETWPDTVSRVVHGNIALVYGNDVTKWSKKILDEADRLAFYMDRFAIIPAGRQLWATGVPGRQFLFNCHVSGWGQKFSEHFAFTFMRLVEGGGVGANYSATHAEKYGAPLHPVKLGIRISDDHPDYKKVEPYINDVPGVAYWDVEDTREGWADALEWLIDVAMIDEFHGQDELYLDLSGIRREGAPLVSSGGVAAGPAPLARMLTEVAGYLNDAYEAGRFSSVKLMEMDHSISVGAVSGGSRRSARMSAVHWKDPDIFEFINSKADGKNHWTTNISVEIDQEFIDQVTARAEDGRPYGNYAQQVHLTVTEAMLRNGEPGYWNSEKSQEGEPGTIIATNPCGEIPLEAWEACNLGSVNLDYFASPVHPWGYDEKGLEEAHRLLTRFLIRSTYADINDPMQRIVQDRNRRIGVGHIGVQGFFAKAFEIRYSEIPFYNGGPHLNSAGLLQSLYKEVRNAARDYAFELRIPEPVKVTTVQPAGTIAKMPGVTEGIHPIYAKWYERRVRFSRRKESEFEQVMEYLGQGFTVEDDIYDPSGMTAVVVFPTEDLLVHQVRDEWGISEDIVESAEDLTVQDMLNVQAFYQENWADNAVSYTVNIPEGAVTTDELAEILREYLPRLKGTTIMVDASREQAPYTRISQMEYAVAAAKTVEDSTDEACATGACPIR